MQSQTPNLYIHVPLMYTDVSISQIRSQQGLKIPARERKLSFFFFFIRFQSRTLKDPKSAQKEAKPPAGSARTTEGCNCAILISPPKQPKPKSKCRVWVWGGRSPLASVLPQLPSYSWSSLSALSSTLRLLPPLST